ncbi:MAG: hypothetical protein NVS3B14_08430 [Ktedonobacteraceae bacterium]
MGQIGYFFNILFTFPIFNGLMLLYHVLGDFGLAIIVLTVLIRLILFPLTLRQLKSTKAGYSTIDRGCEEAVSQGPACAA